MKAGKTWWERTGHWGRQTCRKRLTSPCYRVCEVCGVVIFNFLRTFLLVKSCRRQRAPCSHLSAFLGSGSSAATKTPAGNCGKATHHHRGQVDHLGTRPFTQQLDCCLSSILLAALLCGASIIQFTEAQSSFSILCKTTVSCRWRERRTWGSCSVSHGFRTIMDRLVPAGGESDGCDGTVGRLA
jgi:hypothetical protein